MMNIPSVLNLIVAVFFLSILPVLGYALTPDQVFDKVKDSIVVVKTLDAQGKVEGQGSGVLLPSGKIATNCHVVEGGVSYQVGRGKELVSATLYAEDADRDICILDAKGITGKPVQLGKAAGLKVGDPVYAVGARVEVILGVRCKVSRHEIQRMLKNYLPGVKIVESKLDERTFSVVDKSAA